MQENNFINSALKVIQIEGKAILGLQDQIEETFDDLCTHILATKGKLILMGIGKSGHIAQKYLQHFLAQVLHHFLFTQQKLRMVI